jgi:hypothetical protein
LQVPSPFVVKLLLSIFYSLKKRFEFWLAVPTRTGACKTAALLNDLVVE